jgi:CDP-glycerol glycerophosphotransferase (TagB/SpsB family)
VTYNFVESEEMKTKFNRGRYRLSHNSFQHIVWCGYPVFEQCYNNKYNEITDEMSVVWTPRWSYDKNVGGSHFMEYKDLFIEIAQEYPEVTFVFRPHPLMWDNLKKNKLMSDEEIEGYKKKLDEVGIKLDKNRAFSKTARKASILITDISSILPEFLLTRKPIIYCPCNVRVTKTYQRLVGGTYLAYSENDIRTYLAKLIEGNDDKLELRKKIISQNFEYLTSATNNIMDYLYHSINEVT